MTLEVGTTTNLSPEVEVLDVKRTRMKALATKHLELSQSTLDRVTLEENEMLTLKKHVKRLEGEIQKEKAAQEIFNVIVEYVKS